MTKIQEYRSFDEIPDLSVESIPDQKLMQKEDQAMRETFGIYLKLGLRNAEADAGITCKEPIPRHIVVSELIKLCKEEGQRLVEES